MSRDAAPRSVALSGVQAAFDFIDVGTRKWDNEIEVLHNLGDGCMLKSLNAHALNELAAWKYRSV